MHGTIKDEKQIQQQIVNVCKFLGLIDLEALRDFVADADRQNQMYDAVGAIMDPTNYRDAMYDGRYEDAKHQLKIAKAALALLETIHEREDYIQSLKDHGE